MSRPLVTIDDPVTIIEPHRVLLEWVEAVNRDGFIVRSQSEQTYASNHRHDAEGTTWARGHHLPESATVIALRAAASLGVHEEEKPKIGGAAAMLAEIFGEMHQLPPPESFAETRKLLEEAQRSAKDAEKKTVRPWTSSWLPWIKR